MSYRSLTTTYREHRAACPQRVMPRLDSRSATRCISTLPSLPPERLLPTVSTLKEVCLYWRQRCRQNSDRLAGWRSHPTTRGYTSPTQRAERSVAIVLQRMGDSPSRPRSPRAREGGLSTLLLTPPASI